MESFLLFEGCLALFIIQIILLVTSMKKKKRKYWIISISLEFFTIVAAIVLIYYYEYLATLRYLYLGEVLTCFCAGFLSFIMLCITSIAGIIVFEKSQKSKGKKSANPFRLITAFIFIMTGIVSLSLEIKDNFGKVEMMGTVIDFEEQRFSNGEVKYWPVVQYDVDDQEHQDSFPIPDVKVGDTVKIYYSVYDNYWMARQPADNKIIWIPTIIIGMLIIFFRFKDNIKSCITSGSLT